MNQNLHSTLPLNTSKIKATIFEPRGLPQGRTNMGTTIKGSSKLFRSRSLHFKATRFRRACECVAKLSDYQNVKSFDSYISPSIQVQRRMSFALDPYTRDPYKGKKNETKSICFTTDLSNQSKVWSTTYESPSLHTAFLSDRNAWIDTYIKTEFFSLVTKRIKGLHARRD